MSSEETLSNKIASRLASLCKPPDSLGELERVAARLCEIQKTLEPVTRPRHVTIFAADHGVTCEGVTAWPSIVTGKVVDVMQHGRSASGVFAKVLDCRYEVVDVGLLSAIHGSGSLVIQAAKRRSTGNMLREPAMSEADFEHAWSVGAERARLACEASSVLLIGGEMGIGNTTSASCLIGLFTGAQPDLIVGRGAGLDDDKLIHKRQVVKSTIERVRSIGATSAKEIACQVGGLEIVALAGFYTEGSRLGATLLIDGLIATAAALIAARIDPSVRDRMIAGHRSTEPGHLSALEHLALSPVLDLKMRLGEGTGALVALPILDLAAAMVREMATLEELKLE